MMHQVCAVRDSASGAYMRPFCAATSGVAVRSFSDEAVREGSEIKKHPSDYELWLLAEWDEESGQFNQVAPRCLARAADYVV